MTFGMYFLCTVYVKQHDVVKSGWTSESKRLTRLVTQLVQYLEFVEATFPYLWSDICFLLILCEEYMTKFAFIFSGNVFIPYAGNTVIHLDQALARMREYERMKTEAERSTNTRCTCRIVEDEDGAAAAATVPNLEGVFLVD